MQRALAVAHVAARELRALRECESCGQPLRPLFCGACARPFCRCAIARHELCDGVRRDEQLLRVVDALNSVCEWARLSRVAPQPSRSCALKLRLRLRPPPPTVWLTLRVQPPRPVPSRPIPSGPVLPAIAERPQSVRANTPLRRTKRRRVPSRRTLRTASTLPIPSTQPPPHNHTSVHPRHEKPISQQTTQPPPETALHQPQPSPPNHSQLRANLLINTLETQHSTKSSPRRSCDTQQHHPHNINKRQRSSSSSLEQRHITPPVKKRKHIRQHNSAPTTTVVKTSTRLKVSQSAPSEHEQQIAEEAQPQQPLLAPSTTVAPVIVEQPFITPSIESTEINNDACPPRHGECRILPDGLPNAAKPSTNSSQSLDDAHNSETKNGNTARTTETPSCERQDALQHLPTSKSLIQAVDNGDAADDKLSEGTTNPCARDDGYQDDPITPVRDVFDAKHLNSASKLAGRDTITRNATKPNGASKWKSPSPRTFLSPLTTEKRKQPLLLDSDPLTKVIKPAEKPQLDIASGAFAVCLSDFGDDEQHELVFEIITQMGGEPLEHMRATRPDCLITPMDPRTGAIKSRNMAVHQALASRVPIVGIRWLLDSFKKGRWLPPDNYDASAAFHRGETGIFKGLIATIDDLFLAPDGSETVVQLREDIKRLIVGAEGVVVDSDQLALRVQGDSHFNLHVHVVKGNEEGRGGGGPELAPQQLEALRCTQDKIPMKVISMAWLSECLFSGQCPPPESSEIHSASTVSPIPSR
ncbi:short-chain dehydrogenase/reductase SDR [Gracilaria domingensis]|nr:short-chain dehydrogenase/reductase SDR [Gracilaria domingensis]